MMRKPAIFLSGLFGVAALVYGQDIIDKIMGSGGKPALAVTEFRGATNAQPLMAAFNSTLFSDLDSSGLFDMKPKSMYPLNNPQRPEDLRAGANQQGFSLSDWAGAPVNASHLAFGYAAAVNGAFALYGDLYDTRQQPQSAQLLAQRYAGTLDEAGAIKVAHEYANDIIQKFGGSASLLGSRIYFVSQRAKDGPDEVWTMDWDGNNQKQLTRLGTISVTPGVSPDGSRLAFTTFPKGRQPQITIIDTQSGRNLPFYNQQASLNATPNFSPDGKQIFYASTAAGGQAQIFAADTEGRGFRRVSHRESAIEVEPKVNPKNADIIYFVSGPGAQQIYKMNAQGAGVERVTNGEGEASNPSWSPDGQTIAFSWTRGYSKGDWNIFVMDVASRKYVQLTHSEGKNENPSWAPDGRHLVFASTRGGHSQIYTMLANGSQVKQLTQGGFSNKQPVWGVK